MTLRAAVERLLAAEAEVAAAQVALRAALVDEALGPANESIRAFRARLYARPLSNRERLVAQELEATCAKALGEEPNWHALPMRASERVGALTQDEAREAILAAIAKERSDE